jgi:hypothetical protein
MHAACSACSTDARCPAPACPHARTRTPQGETGAYKFVGGEFFNESVPYGIRYSDFMFKLSEKFRSAVSVKYQPPGEELVPDQLITVQDDADLQVSSGSGRVVVPSWWCPRGGALATAAPAACCKRSSSGTGARCRQAPWCSSEPHTCAPRSRPCYQQTVCPAPTNTHTRPPLQTQELQDDYLTALARPGTPYKTFRIKVYVFAAAEDPLTPDEIMEGAHFFGGCVRACVVCVCAVSRLCVRWGLSQAVHERIALQQVAFAAPLRPHIADMPSVCCACRVPRRPDVQPGLPPRLTAFPSHLDGRSSLGSTLSSIGTPSARHHDGDCPSSRCARGACARVVQRRDSVAATHGSVVGPSLPLPWPLPWLTLVSCHCCSLPSAASAS